MKRNCFYYWNELRDIVARVTPYSEDVRKLTADERRFARADFAWDAAWNVASQFVADYDKRFAVASSLLWLEERGLYGGGTTAPGTSTKRLRFFRHLGKGRRNATDGASWTEAISRAARRYGFLQWDLTNDGLGIRFSPHPHEEEALKECILPLRTVLFIDGDESSDAVEAWLGATKHAIKEFGRPRHYGVDEQTKDLLTAAVQEYTEAKVALSRARAREAAAKEEGKDEPVE